MQSFDLAEQNLKSTAQRRCHAGWGLLRRGTKSADFAIQPGKIKRIALGKTCLCLGQGFPHGLDGGQNRHAMAAGFDA